MANTEPISVRLSEELLQEIDAEKERLGVSRNWVINRRLQGSRKNAPSLDDFDIFEAEKEVSKKIADISVGGGATEGGGDPCLPRGGKAQDGTNFVVLPPEGEDLSIRPEKIIPAENGADYFVAPRSDGWSEELLRKMADAEPSGLMACSSDRMGWLLENAKTDAVTASNLHHAGVALDREILVRWGLVENYKPETEEKRDAEIRRAKGRGKAGQDRGTAGGDSQPVAEGDNGAQEPAVGVGKPGVNMQALRDICEGNLQPFAFAGDIPDEMKLPPDLGEVDLCGFKSYNETDGEWYVCAKEKHGIKVKHGDWIKI